MRYTDPRPLHITRQKTCSIYVEVLTMHSSVHYGAPTLSQLILSSSHGAFSNSCHSHKFTCPDTTT